VDPFPPSRLPETPELGVAGAIDPLQPDDFDLESLLQEALTALQAGEIARAESIYGALLEAGHADVRMFSNLAALALQRKEADEALPWLERGLELDPHHPRCLLNFGMALQLKGRTPEAIAALRSALAADPSLAEAWNNLGVALTHAHVGPELEADGEAQTRAKQQAINEAIAAYRRALELRPQYGQAALNLARLLADEGDPLAGEAVLRALPSEAMGGEELFGLGDMLRLLGRFEQSTAIYGEALAKGPGNGDLRLGVGIALISCGQADQALMELLPLLAQRPEDPLPMVATGWALQTLGEIRQAMDFFRKALALDPAQVRARNLLGLCHNDLGEHSEAILQFRAGLQESPKDVELRCNLAGALRHQGDLDGSMREIEQLLQEFPTSMEAFSIQLFSCSVASERLAPLALEVGARYWDLVRRQPLPLRPLELGLGLPPATAAWRGANPGPAMAEVPMVVAIPADDRRLRIGFLSAEIGDHVVGSFLSSFLDHYDRSRFAVELFVASRRFEATAERMAAQADHHWLLSGMAADHARALIRSRQLAILVETSGFTRDSGIELLAQRCAPVQCHYIGYHATTGLDTIDWFIGDQETVPESFAPQFVEGLWRLPRPWLARRPDPSLPAAQSIATENHPVLGSFNQLTKVREETLSYWLAALQALPAGHLVIKDRSVNDPVVRERISAFLGRGGVAAERIRFLPPIGSWEEHMAAYNQLDVALDATPWSSATTGFDALAMGVPLVAIRGGCTSARMSSAILKGLGRPEWIAATPEQFGDIVAGLCADLPVLRAGKQSLREEVLASPLFDGEDLCRALEQAFQAMVAVPIKKPPRGACG
jgi:predicted O-linked N-acetylglucosamine transferase (SPINDLY family)